MKKSQHTIEYFFEQYGVSDPDTKAKILPEITGIIYEYNMHVVKLEKEEDLYRQKQILVGIDELEKKIADVFADLKK